MAAASQLQAQLSSDLCLTWSETPKTEFLARGMIYNQLKSLGDSSLTPKVCDLSGQRVSGLESETTTNMQCTCNRRLQIPTTPWGYHPTLDRT